MLTNKILPALLFSLVALTGCKSDSADQSSDNHDFPCICGTADAALNSCLHSTCVSGEGNDENPDCACGTLSINQ
jgi:hypothetical protein